MSKSLFPIVSVAVAALFVGCSKQESRDVESLKAQIQIHEENMKILNQQMTELNRRLSSVANAVEDHRVRVLELEKKAGLRTKGRR